MVESACLFDIIKISCFSNIIFFKYNLFLFHFSSFFTFYFLFASYIITSKFDAKNTRSFPTLQTYYNIPIPKPSQISMLIPINEIQ